MQSLQLFNCASSSAAPSLFFSAALLLYILSIKSVKYGDELRETLSTHAASLGPVPCTAQPFLTLSCVRRPSSIWPSLRRHRCLCPYCCPRLTTLTLLVSNAAAALEVPHRLCLCLCVCFFCCLLKPRSLLQFHLPTLSLASGSICYCFQSFPLSLSFSLFLSLFISLFVLLRCF